MNKLKSKLSWLFGKHYAIERFGVLFCVLMLALSGVVASVMVKRNGDKKEQLGSQVMYSTAFTMSKSKATGQVVSVNVSNDKTKALVLLKYDDTSRMATNAKDYSMYLTGTNQNKGRTDLQSAPEGSVYVFGNSGYVVFYLVDVNGFPSQILDLTFRSNNPFEDGDAIADANDGSFAKYDQARIYFNPGASGSETVACLEDGDMSPYHIYESVLIEQQERDLKTQMEDALKTMQQAQARISAAEKTVEDKNLQIPQAPDKIAGDYITQDENGQLNLTVMRPLPGSHEFDWRNNSVATGYMDDILQMTGFTNETDYFAAKTEEKQADNAGLRVQDVLWYMTDGTAVTLYGNSNSLSTAEKLRNDAMQALVNAWQDYYNAKELYTVTLPSQLLDLEIISREMTSNYTVRMFTDDTDNNKVLWLY